MRFGLGIELPLLDRLGTGAQVTILVLYRDESSLPPRFIRGAGELTTVPLCMVFIST